MCFNNVSCGISATRDDPRVHSGVLCASYSRFSSSLQRADSISDQQRRCRERADSEGHVIARELEFSDEAVSGTTLHRDGLDAMLDAAKAGRFQVLYLYSLSRLARESIITMPVLKTLVYNHGVRVISTSEGLDSDQHGWDLMATVLSIIHEQYIKDLANAVFRGQEGAVLAGFSVGDCCFGYTTVPVSGSESGRRGRDVKPRMVYVVDQEKAPWVVRVFHWFVCERRSIRWITRELNRLDAPKDHRSRTKHWQHPYVRRLLANTKYLGDWTWGEYKTVRDPNTGKVRREKRPEEQCAKWSRRLPHLQLIDNETFDEAKRLLQHNENVCGANRKKNGKLTGSTSGTSRQHPRHLLSGLIRCEQCGRIFSVGGVNGRYLFCPGYVKGVCSCKTQLQRNRAEQMILDEIGRRILSNAAWRKAVLNELRIAWHAQESQLPSELVAAEKLLAEVSRKIENLVDRVENGHDEPELSKRLAQRRAENQKLTERIDRLQRASQDHRLEPTEVWLDEQLRHLGDVLSGENPAAAHALRDLVGGSIVVTEIRRPGCKRHFFRGNFKISTAALLNSLDKQLVNDENERAAEAPELEEEIVIDFRALVQYETASERAKVLYDQGFLMTEIGAKLGRANSYVTKIIKYWFESRGLPVPDSHRRRFALAKKFLLPPQYQAIADDAKELMDQGILLQEIAERLHCDRNTITSAIRHWHISRGLPVPDGRTRRKTLTRKVSHPRRHPGENEGGDVTEC